MTDIKLPAGYEDWVEVPMEPEGEFVKSEVIHWSARYGTGGRSGMPIEKLRYFVPPKPKPALPNVKPGAVLRYTDKLGRKVRAVYPSSRLWNVYHQPHAPLNTACHMMIMSESQILADVNADGFTVELDGL